MGNFLETECQITKVRTRVTIARDKETKRSLRPHEGWAGRLAPKRLSATQSVGSVRGTSCLRCEAGRIKWKRELCPTR